MYTTTLDGYNEIESKKQFDFKETFEEYFKNKAEVKEIETYLVSLDSLIQQIENNLKMTNISIEPFSSSNGFDATKTSGSFSTESYIEKNMMREIEKLENDLVIAKSKKIQYGLRLNRLKLKITEIEMFVNMLSKINFEIIKLKYAEEYKKNNIEIGIELNFTETAVRKRLTEMKISFENWAKVMHI